MISWWKPSQKQFCRDGTAFYDTFINWGFSCKGVFEWRVNWESKNESEKSKGKPQLLPLQSQQSWEWLRATCVLRSISMHLIWCHLSHTQHWIPFWLHWTGFSQIAHGNFHADFFTVVDGTLQSGLGFKLISPLVASRAKLKVVTELG